MKDLARARNNRKESGFVQGEESQGSKIYGNTAKGIAFLSAVRLKSTISNSRRCPGCFQIGIER